MSSASNSLRHWAALFALAGASVVATFGVFELGIRTLVYEPIYAVYSCPEIFWRKDDLLGWSHTPKATDVYVGPRPWPVEFEAPVRINCWVSGAPRSQSCQRTAIE